MNRIVLTSLVGTVAAAALVAGVGVPAFASTSTSPPSTKTTHTLVSVQAAAKTATDKRETALSAAIAKLDAAKGISASDKATLMDRLNTDLAGMKTVEATVAADTTLAAASADFKTIFTTYRVFAVAIPLARIVAGIDRATSMEIPKLTASQTKLVAMLAGKDASKSTAALQSDLADMTTQIAAANTALSGASAKVLAITPADFNSNKTVVTSARASVKTAENDLKQARADRKAIIAALK
jgi:alkylation response protein AidB-like acyl-CoA dehydrogenase